MEFALTVRPGFRARCPNCTDCSEPLQWSNVFVKYTAITSDSEITHMLVCYCGCCLLLLNEKWSKVNNAGQNINNLTKAILPLVEDVALMEFMYLVFTRTPCESYRRRLRSLLLHLCYVFRALINSLVCWYKLCLWNTRFRQLPCAIYFLFPMFIRRYIISLSTPHPPP